ncbi:methyltransferase family protein [Nafulsella turpanensis]|uniref:methyltransferase family protein n=1 Tax=Nafulsella turpanensis TaxID=1265690 RepID=UPI00034B3168|nr:isoprenylcysteine carboxylmethyltransferase family protein [Nafulsella turpanensis]
MLLNQFEKSGNWLFRYRSYLPVVLFPFAALVVLFGDVDFSSSEGIGYAVFCFLVSIAGLAVRAYTVGHTPKGTSGRNTAEGQVAETLNTTGIYSAMRHPLYLGNYLMWMGPILYVGSTWFAVVCSLMFWLYYERIMFAEEAFLYSKYREKYKEWANRTPAFIPSFKRWQKSNLDFSFRNVLKREYNGLFYTALSFVFVDVLRNYMLTGGFYVLEFWKIVFVACLLLLIVLKTLKRGTRVLDVEGR